MPAAGGDDAAEAKRKQVLYSRIDFLSLMLALFAGARPRCRTS